MSHFDFKKHLRKQILIREGWEAERDRQEREAASGTENKTWGIDSNLTDEEEASPLMSELPGDMDEGHKKELADLILSLTDEVGIKLEEINLIGLRSERDRVIKSDKIVALLRRFQKEDSEYYSDENILKLAKILNYWGRRNSIKFVTQSRLAAAPEEIDEPATEKEKYRMSLKSLKRTLMKSIDPKIDKKVEWINDIASAVIKDIPDMRLNEARDPVSFSNTLAVLKLLKAVYEQQDLDFKPFERTVYDFLKVNNLEASEAAPELYSGTYETLEDEDEYERAETEEVLNPDGPRNEEEKAGFTKALDTIQAGLDVAGVAGLFPPLAVISAPATLISLILNLSRGKFGWALFDLITLVPVAGGIAKSGKVGKGMKAAAVAGKWKTGRAMIGALGSADRAKKALGAAKAGSSALELAQATKGATHLIGEMIPDEQWNKIVNAKIPENLYNFVDEKDRNKLFVDWVLDYLGDKKVPEVGKLRDAWDEAKKVKNNKPASHPDDGNDADWIPPEEGGHQYDFMRENLNLNERKYIMLLERFKIK
jgi:hypothetical protein